MYCSQNFSRAEKRAFKLVGLPKSPENKPIQLHFILTCNSGKANQGETKLWVVFAGSMTTAASLLSDRPDNNWRWRHFTTSSRMLQPLLVDSGGGRQINGQESLRTCTESKSWTWPKKRFFPKSTETHYEFMSRIWCPGTTCALQWWFDPEVVYPHFKNQIHRCIKTNRHFRVMPFIGYQTTSKQNKKKVHNFFVSLFVILQTAT